MTTTYEASGEVRAGGEASARVQQREVAFDGSATMGAELPGPAHLMASALAACILKNVERFSGMLGFVYEVARAHITLTRQDSPPRIIDAAYVLEIESEADDGKLRLLYKNINKFGTITNTLAAAMPVRGELWVVRADGQRLLVTSGGVDGTI
jgi:uncharacterized OsmC-like protein